MANSVYIGYDPREIAPFIVARYSIRRFDRQVPIRGVVLDQLMADRLYWRPTERRINSEGHKQLWDVISQAWMSTEHANARFLVPHLAGGGWALFIDGDTLIDRPVSELFARCDPSKALMCVKHAPYEAGAVKMDGQQQSGYERKNWSSVMAFNCSHPANAKLTVELVNSIPGRELHQFCWLDDSDIGALPAEWNHLVGISHPKPETMPALTHFTKGTPDMPGYESQDYADEWRALLAKAAGAI